MARKPTPYSSHRGQFVQPAEGGCGFPGGYWLSFRFPSYRKQTQANPMKYLSALLLLLVSSFAFAEPKVVITTDKPSAVYEAGSKAKWTMEVKDGDKSPPGMLQFRVLWGTEEAQAGELPAAGPHTLQQDCSGHAVFTLEVKYKPEGGKEIKGVSVVVLGPEKITRSSPIPDDFDAFWKAKIAELDAVPMNVKAEKIDIGDPKIEYYKITMPNNVHVWQPHSPECGLICSCPADRPRSGDRGYRGSPGKTQHSLATTA